MAWPVGLALGYALPAGARWWAGLTTPAEPGMTEETGRRTFALNELMVSPDWQRRGVAHALHDELLGHRGEDRATLLVREDNTTAQRAYGRWGWQKVGKVQPFPDSPHYDALILPLPVRGRPRLAGACTTRRTAPPPLTGWRGRSCARPVRTPQCLAGQHPGRAHAHTPHSGQVPAVPVCRNVAPHRQLLTPTPGRSFAAAAFRSTTSSPTGAPVRECRGGRSIWFLRLNMSSPRWRNFTASEPGRGDGEARPGRDDRHWGYSRCPTRKPPGRRTLAYGPRTEDQ